ncbi:ABC transporter ATP-binding protein [Pseudokineococcus marinus]|uniref:ABC transporter ATP-binding protein n=1 Tax=Pseudokineococcus marinus TaxID=351215 RepID=A0A849BQY4_9ACTN|nr:ABC transporter ATP-binding protein [Pseudokineococcus marinus]NNH22924.1 ABC transporter ATP-binding protein [Pseudokineococcus marinus]
MIVAEHLTKRYGGRTAVDDVSFTVEPGRVTGFLGPNGAGKSTTMRMVVGLDRPTSGRVTVDGRAYADSPAPLQEVGALLEARAVHPGRSARSHLRALAATHGIGDARVDEVVAMTGLSAVARRRVGGFSLGMGQRLGIAAALLGDPRVLVLDEPVNGLDPEGVRWVRQTVRHLADEGRTVFISSHLMSEMAITADDLVVIGRGRVVAQGPVRDVVGGVGGASVLVRSPRAGELGSLLERSGARLERRDDGALVVRGPDAAAVGDLAAGAGIAVHELTPQQSSLEDAFMTLTADAVEYATSPSPPAGPHGSGPRPAGPGRPDEEARA